MNQVNQLIFVEVCLCCRKIRRVEALGLIDPFTVVPAWLKDNRWWLLVRKMKLLFQRWSRRFEAQIYLGGIFGILALFIQNLWNAESVRPREFWYHAEGVVGREAAQSKLPRSHRFSASEILNELHKNDKYSGQILILRFKSPHLKTISFFQSEVIVFYLFLEFAGLTGIIWHEISP